MKFVTSIKLAAAFFTTIIIWILGILFTLITFSHDKAVTLFANIWGKLVLKILGIKCEIHGKEHLLTFSPCLFIGNHQSLLDLFVFCLIFPPKTRAIGKSELLKIPLFGILYVLTGNILVNRHVREKGVKAIESAIAKIKRKNCSIFMCPEGTRSPDGKLLPFKKGAFFIAVSLKIPIVPIILHNTGALLPKHSLDIKPGVVYVDILPPILTADWKIATLDQHKKSMEILFQETLNKRSRSL